MDTSKYLIWLVFWASLVLTGFAEEILRKITTKKIKIFFKFYNKIAVFVNLK